ncbi:R.Pab1 family restriction endonuclease [Helicobacter sp. 23-1044]
MRDFSVNYALPLTAVAGKVRIKERNTFSDYGLPIAPTKTRITIKHYIEWQIGYDEVVAKDDFHFMGANGKPKNLFELSQIVQKFYQNGVIKKSDLLALKDNVEQNSELIENVMKIMRSNFVPRKIANMDFLESQISYPLLVHKFENDEFLSEIVVREKQRAVGIQAMLYFCFPVYLLKNANGNSDFLGRCINSKEMGFLEINQNNIHIFLKMLQIFGILSQNHKHDVIEILNFILKS